METPAYLVGLPKLQAPESVKDGLIQIQTRGSDKPHELFKHSHQQMLREEHKQEIIYYFLTLPSSNCFQLRSFLESTGKLH